jgi:hypothetical protein
VRSSQPPLEYLLTCSQSSLEGFELARLDQVSHLRLEIRNLHEQWIEAEVAARLARFLLDGRRPGAATENDARAALGPMSNGLAAALSSLNSTRDAPMLERFSASLFSSPSLGPCSESVAPLQPAPIPFDGENLLDQQDSLPQSHSDWVDSLPARIETAPPSPHLNVDRDCAKKGPNRIRRRPDSKRAESIRSPVSRLHNSGSKNNYCREPASNAPFAAMQIQPLRQLVLFQTHPDPSSNSLRADDAGEGPEIALRIFVSGLMLAIPENPKTLKRCSGSYRTGLVRR